MVRNRLSIVMIVLFGISLLEGLYNRSDISARNEVHHETEDKLDWMMQVARIVGPKKKWDQQGAQRILEKCIKEDKEAVKTIDNQIEKSGDGLVGTAAALIDHGPLAKAKTQLKYHETVLKVLSELPKNEKERNKIVSKFVSLYENDKHLQKLEKDYKATHGTKAAAVFAKITGQKLKIKGLQTALDALLIKESFDR